jgi:hypothetical protein
MFRNGIFYHFRNISDFTAHNSLLNVPFLALPETLAVGKLFVNNSADAA